MYSSPKNTNIKALLYSRKGGFLIPTTVTSPDDLLHGRQAGVAPHDCDVTGRPSSRQGGVAPHALREK